MVWGAVVIATAAWMAWRAGPPAAKLSPAPPATVGAAFSGGEKRPQDRIQPPSPETVDATTIPNVEKHDSLEARVLTRLRDWEENDDSDLRGQRMQELDALLAGTNALAIVQDLPPDLMDYAFALPALHRQMLADPIAAADWMRSHTNISDAHVFTLIHDWGQENREALQEYLASLPEGEWKQRAVTAASSEALSRDPAEAVAWAEQMNRGEQQTGLLEMAATDWVKLDPEAAAQWVKRVDDPELREELAGALAVGYADLDPAAAAQSVMQSFPPGEVLNRSVAEIAWTWAMREPTAAIAWVAQFPEGPARQMALGNVMGVWGNRDREAALDWVASLPPGRLQIEAATDLQQAIPADTAAAP